ncbi:hypothetical protein JOB18_016239 [Solea senegalensis]|uniref:Uncharacterized protein n=1 Tax=Solea senegalensis TaxID=28829 RepID=A0AAV6SRR5_SOLSE|nr:hypothetical protein JOB18_016239 [Solea senegalensis]
MLAMTVMFKDPFHQQQHEQEPQTSLCLFVHIFQLCNLQEWCQTLPSEHKGGDKTSSKYNGNELDYETKVSWTYFVERRDSGGTLSCQNPDGSCSSSPPSTGSTMYVDKC